MISNTMKSIRAASLLTLASLATALAVPSAAKSTIFTVGGQQYDVTTFTGSQSSNSSLFNTPSAGGAMPWWGNGALAAAFANAIGGGLGLAGGIDGPSFAYGLTEDEFAGTLVDVKIYRDGSGAFGSSYAIDESTTYARATLIPPSATPTPGPLPILGAASAFGMSRRLRRRIASQAFKL